MLAAKEKGDVINTELFSPFGRKLGFAAKGHRNGATPVGSVHGPSDPPAISGPAIRKAILALAARVMLIVLLPVELMLRRGALPDAGNEVFEGFGEMTTNLDPASAIPSVKPGVGICAAILHGCPNHVNFGPRSAVTGHLFGKPFEMVSLKTSARADLAPDKAVSGDRDEIAAIALAFPLRAVVVESGSFASVA